MEGQRQRSGGGRRRRRKARSEQRPAKSEPVLIAARRPNSPFLVKSQSRSVAASAAPKRDGARKSGNGMPVAADRPVPRIEETPRRAARIVQARTPENDEQELRRRRLLQRVMDSEGRGAISRAADEYLESGFELPEEQEVYLQLLEHFNEERARQALDAMNRLLSAQPPIKRPVLDQRLRRLEEHADEATTRNMAAALRRTIRA